MVNSKAKATLTQALISLFWPPLLIILAFLLTREFEVSGEVISEEACMAGLALLLIAGAATLVMIQGVILLFVGIYQSMKYKDDPTQTEHPSPGSGPMESAKDNRGGLGGAPVAQTTPTQFNKRKNNSKKVLTIGLITLLLAAGVVGYAKWMQPASVEEVWIGEAPITLEIHLDRTLPSESDQRGPFEEYIFYSNSENITVTTEWADMHNQTGPYWCDVSIIVWLADTEEDECNLRNEIDGREHIGSLTRTSSSGDYIIHINGTGEVAIYKHTPQNYSSLNLFTSLFILSSTLIMVGGWMWASKMKETITFHPTEGSTSQQHQEADVNQRPPSG